MHLSALKRVAVVLRSRCQFYIKHPSVLQQCLALAALASPGDAEQLINPKVNLCIVKSQTPGGTAVSKVLAIN